MTVEWRKLTSDFEQGRQLYQYFGIKVFILFYNILCIVYSCMIQYITVTVK